MTPPERPTTRPDGQASPEDDTLAVVTTAARTVFGDYVSAEKCRRLHDLILAGLAQIDRPLVLPTKEDDGPA